MSERRYGEDEVAAIFEAASAPEASRRRTALAEGLTLAELQAIGREVGIPPERIAHAATSLDRPVGAAPRRTELGMPIGVGLTVDLPRAPTDHEWALLVSELRATFNARGRESSQGVLRHWSNSNLFASVEPTESGYQLRMGTVKGNAVATNRIGGFFIAMAAVLMLIAFFGGAPSDDIGGALWLALMGSGALGANAIRLPRWAGERERQMEHVAERARALLASGPEQIEP